MSRKQKEEYYRFFTVSDTRTHEKGHTEYRITARFVSKSHPEDVKEIVVWRRFSELKKLHGELAYTHRNLFRREEEFPPFPRAQVFGRFDEAVIEERRRAAEVMFSFTTTIPALYNSPQLKDFFRGGEVSRPLDPTVVYTSGTLPPPLIPLPKRRASDCLPADEEMGHEAPTLPQDLGNNLGLELGEPEVAAEAFCHIRGSPEEPSDSELDDRVPSPFLMQDLQESQEELNSLFDSVVEDEAPHTDDAPPPLSQDDLATFDPYYNPGDSDRCSDHSELFSLPLDNMNSGAAYLTSASSELTAAMEKEKEGELSAAIVKYRTAVDILITGVQENCFISPLMDPSDFFDNATHQMSIFSENPCSFYPPSCQEPPKHSLIQHLQPGMPRQLGRMHGSNMSLQRNQDPILERQNLATEIRSKVGTENNILGVKKKRMDYFNWNQNLPQVKKKRPESHEQSENIGRKKRKDRDELKEQVGQLKERLVTLQEKVWRAFAQQHLSQNDRKWRNINELSEDKSIGVDRKEDLFANVLKKHTGSQGPKDVVVEAGERTLEWNCTELSRGDWDGEQCMVDNGCQQFAQLLKVELRNAMAMVIDRVLTIYTEASEPDFSSPPAVSFVAEANEKWGIVKKISKRAHEMDGKDRNTAPKQSNQPTEATAVRIQLPPLGPSRPNLISPDPLSKDHCFLSHPTAPLAPRYPPFHPLQSMDTPPLLHYSMHQLFSRTLSHVPSPPVKNFHVTREPLAELERPVFSVLMPQLELLEPPLSSQFTDMENGRRAEVGIREAGGAVDLYLSSSVSQEGLSPCHLKKAKLMFFYTRYPTSNTLKTYFPDVKVQLSFKKESGCLRTLCELSAAFA
ncbi:uncharacterized protein LOC110171946 isoform X2 [Boleophthalmus pectinirostris]|uniref:uncharacterized protein LOC110171946 isoform X2 n=1 Tax=Boleophthalmus pectinirostris TaxID=150288 RepID=UPI0024307B24|nr:uncharacterized protein LOC110171946 isoform X2 [Boleophthalmus pectinirostris]